MSSLLFGRIFILDPAHRAGEAHVLATLRATRNAVRIAREVSVDGLGSIIVIYLGQVVVIELVGILCVDVLRRVLVVNCFGELPGPGKSLDTGNDVNIAGL